MRHVETYVRRVRTSRCLVFENIMDLDHVCVVHARWFGHLRIREWRADHVDYRLRAAFHGFRSEFDVRGRRVDDDGYWYEFEAPLALIRVDGRLEGTDGDLVLTETITYSFAALLWPVFAALRPLFRRQKEDILRDDTRLLERAHELEATGFRRSVDHGRPRVVVFGGTGFFGRLVVRDVLERTNALVHTVSRAPLDVDFRPHETRVHAWIADLRDGEAVRRIVRGAAACVVCVGPFQGLETTIAESCAAERVPYLDIAEDRDFVERAQALDARFREAGVPAFVGCSVIPGISALLVRAALLRVRDAETVRVSITPGTRHVRGPGSFACLLSTVGRTYEAPHEGRPRAVVGWTEPRAVEFPLDVGRRTAYRVVDVADHALMPRRFGSRTVEFRIGSEFGFLNRLLVLHRVATGRLPRPIAAALIPAYRALVSAVGRFGTTRGAMAAEVTDSQGRTAALCAHRGAAGEVIPSLLPSIAVERVLAGAAPPAGVVALADWLSPAELAAALRARGVELSERVADGPCVLRR